MKKRVDTEPAIYKNRERKVPTRALVAGMILTREVITEENIAIYAPMIYTPPRA
jgi:hypothetical protein